MGGIYCAVFLWSEKPWRHSVNQTWVRGQLSTFPCFNGDEDVEAKAYDTPPASVMPSLKAASFASNSTKSFASLGAPPIESAIQALSNIMLLQGQWIEMHFGVSTLVDPDGLQVWLSNLLTRDRTWRGKIVEITGRDVYLIHLDYLLALELEL
jgi:hypothetical protein